MLTAETCGPVRAQVGCVPSSGLRSVYSSTPCRPTGVSIGIAASPPFCDGLGPVPPLSAACPCGIDPRDREVCGCVNGVLESNGSSFGFWRGLLIPFKRTSFARTPMPGRLKASQRITLAGFRTLGTARTWRSSPYSGSTVGWQSTIVMNTPARSGLLIGLPTEWLLKHIVGGRMVMI